MKKARAQSFFTSFRSKTFQSEFLSSDQKLIVATSSLCLLTSDVFGLRCNKGQIKFPQVGKEKDLLSLKSYVKMAKVAQFSLGSRWGQTGKKRKTRK